MHLLLSLAAVLLDPARAAGLPVVHGAIRIQAPAQVPVGQDPRVVITVPDRPSVVFVECTVRLPDGSPQTFSQTSGLLAAGDAAELALDVAPPTAAASCLVVANFANGLSERKPVELSWAWVEVPAPDDDALPPEERAPQAPAPDPATPAPPPPPAAAPQRTEPG